MQNPSLSFSEGRTAHFIQPRASLQPQISRDKKVLYSRTSQKSTTTTHQKKKKKVQHSFMRLLVGSVEPPHSQALGSPHQHVQAKGQILHKGDLPKETFQIHSSCQDPVSGSPAFLTRFISLSSSLLP